MPSSAQAATALNVAEVTKRFGRRPFQRAEFIEQAWFITSVTLVPTILVSVPFGAVISLQVGNLTSQRGAESFAGATAVLATVREAAPIAAARITLVCLDRDRWRPARMPAALVRRLAP